MENQFTYKIEKPLIFKYTIRIENKNYTFNQIRNKLNSSLLEYIFYKNEDNYQGNIYFALNEYFQRHFLITGNSKAFLTDYSENKGSLIISFTILIFGSITNYGAIRETIDYFAKDLEVLFSKSLNNNTEVYSITSNIQDLNNLIFNSQISYFNEVTKQLNSVLTKTKVNRILIGIVFFGLILITILQNNLLPSGNSKQADIDETKIKILISDELRNQKIDDHLKNKIDTIYIKMK
ncbi:hypothetical protein V7S77_13275 [Aquirufa ecclesiirivi]